jgi:peptidoglycan hydrolase CwlO-like protein
MKWLWITLVVLFITGCGRYYIEDEVDIEKMDEYISQLEKELEEQEEEISTLEYDLEEAQASSEEWENQYYELESELFQLQLDCDTDY